MLNILKYLLEIKKKKKMTLKVNTSALHILLFFSNPIYLATIILKTKISSGNKAGRVVLLQIMISSVKLSSVMKIRNSVPNACKQMANQTQHSFFYTFRKGV